MISIVIPVHNEESTIGAVLDRVARLDVGHPKEVILVDDGSTDETANIIRSHDSTIRLEHLALNGGKGTAVRRGIALAQGTVIVIQDADLELSPDVIQHLVEPILAGKADAVYGSRFLVKSERVPMVRRLANRFLTGLTNLLYGTRLTDMETAHKAIRRELVQGLDLHAERFEFEAEVTAKLARSGARILEIASPYAPRTKHEGKKIRTRDGWLAIKTLFSYRRWAPQGAGSPAERTEVLGSSSS